MTKEEIIELIKRDELKLPGFNAKNEAIDSISKLEVGLTLVPLFAGDITKENFDNLVKEYPTIDITE